MPTLGLFAHLVIAPLFVVVALWCAATQWRLTHDRLLILGSPWLPLTVLAGWGLISALWAVNPLNSAFKSLLLMATFWAAAWIWVAVRSDQANTRHIVFALAIGFAVAVALLAIEYGFGMQIMRSLKGLTSPPEDAIVTARNRMKSGATILAIMAWPLIWGLWRVGMKHVAIVAFVGASAGILALPSFAASAAFLAAGLTLLLCLASRKESVAIKTVTGLIMVVSVAAPLLGQLIPNPQQSFQWLWLPYSGHHRLTIWAFASERTMQKPLGGWGMDASREIPGGSSLVEVDRYNTVLQRHETSTEPRLPLHPHNSVLQIWMELGAVGIAVVLWFLWRCVASLTGLASKLNRSFAFSLMVSVLPVSALSYGAWQSWWLATIAFAACFGSAAARSNKSDPSP